MYVIMYLLNHIKAAMSWDPEGMSKNRGINFRASNVFYLCIFLISHDIELHCCAQV